MYSKFVYFTSKKQDRLCGKKLRIQVVVTKVTGSLKAYKPISNSQDISFYDKLDRLVMHYLYHGLFYFMTKELKKRRMRRGRLFRF